MVGRPGVADRGRKIEIQGAGRNYETTVDRDGNLKLSALAPGRYVIVLKADEAFHLSPPAESTTVDVPDKGCAEFDFWVDPFAKKG